MSVPNHVFVVNAVFATGKYALDHAGQPAFVDAAVLALHRFDENWRHLKKSGGQTKIHDHAEDAALYLLPDNKAWAVDFIGGAGGPNPSIAWGPDPEAQYIHADGLDPDEHDQTAPVTGILPKGKAMEVLTRLNAFYEAQDGLQRPGGMIKDGRVDLEAVSQWLFQMVIEGRTWAEVEAQIRASQEWKDKHK